VKEDVEKKFKKIVMGWKKSNEWWEKLVQTSFAGRCRNLRALDQFSTLAIYRQNMCVTSLDDAQW